MKMDYSFQLGKQIHELRKKREILKKEKESESLLIEKNCIDFEGYKEAMKTKKLEKIKKQNQEYDLAIQQKINTTNSFLETKKNDKESLEKSFAESMSDEKKKIGNKEKINKEVALDNIFRANRKRLEKIEEKIKESQYDLLHIEVAQKEFSDNEMRHRKAIRSKLFIAHDETRLLKLVQNKPKSLRDYEEEANLREIEELKKNLEKEEE